MTHPCDIIRNMIRIAKPPHGSLEWLQLRHRYNDQTIVGASEVPIVMGVSPYKTINDLAIEKLQPPQVREQNDAMKRGTFLEQGLLDYAASELNIKISTPDVMYLQDRIICTLDGKCGALIFEAKTTTAWMQGDPVLPEWYWQAQAQMHCTGADHVTFIVLDCNLRFAMFEVAYNDDDNAAMLEAVREFCAAIDSGKMPSDEPLTRNQVQNLHPNADGETELDSAGINAVLELQSVKAHIKELKTREAELEDIIANILKDKSIGTVDGHAIITFKTQTSERFDQKAFATKHPDLANQFKNISSFRVMRIVKGR